MMILNMVQILNYFNIIWNLYGMNQMMMIMVLYMLKIMLSYYILFLSKVSKIIENFWHFFFFVHVIIFICTLVVLGSGERWMINSLILQLSNFYTEALMVYMLIISFYYFL